jgi:hypothetical protein
MSDKTQHIINRGLHAKQLLENPTLNECFDGLLEETFATFLSTESADFDTREKLHSNGVALGMVRGRLQGFVDEQKIEEANAKHDNK